MVMATVVNSAAVAFGGLSSWKDGVLFLEIRETVRGEDFMGIEEDRLGAGSSIRYPTGNILEAVGYTI